MENYTINNFKAWAARQAGFDFQQYPTYVEGQAYNTGDRVIFQDPVSFKFFVYESTADNNTDSPSTADTTKVDADADLSGEILDSEIIEAITEAKFKFNEGLFANEAEKNTAFSLLVAFFLSYDRQMAESGVNGGYRGLASQKRIGEMSISYIADPSLMSGSKAYAFFARNPYGLKYYNLVQSRLKGPTICIGRATNV